MTIDDAKLMALADGELPAAEAADVEAAVAGDPVLARRLAAHRALRAAAGGAFADVLAEPVPERLLAAVRGGAGTVIDLAAARAARDARAVAATSMPVRGPVPHWAALAATLVIGVVAGQMLGVQMPGGQMPGRELAPALLAAEPDLVRALEGDAGGVIQAGLTYRDQAGAYCRTFRGQAAAGVACREAGGWVVKVATAVGRVPATDYRMAAADLPPAVLATIDATIAGAPLDAAGVARARREGWRAAPRR